MCNCLSKTIKKSHGQKTRKMQESGRKNLYHIKTLPLCFGKYWTLSTPFFKY